MVRALQNKNTLRALSAFIAAAAFILLALAPIAASASSAYAPADENVPISNDVSFNTRERIYVYYISEGAAELKCSVLDGMVTSSPVTVKGGGVFLFRNGEEYDGSTDPVSEPGEYVVKINSGERNTRVLAFTIVGRTTNLVTTYEMPEGMIVDKVTFNGEELDPGYTSVPMQQEGQYTVVTECIATGVTYTLETTVDRTPPALEFSGKADSRGRYSSAVTVSGIGKGEKLNVRKDGEPFSVNIENDGTVNFTESGSYQIVAYDEAGNISEYPLYIMVYLNASALAFIALLVLVILAVIIYIRFKRKRLRIG